MDGNLQSLETDYQRQADAEQALKYQNSSRSGQLTDEQVRQGFRQAQITCVGSSLGGGDCDCSGAGGGGYAAVRLVVVVGVVVVLVFCVLSPHVPKVAPAR